MTLALVVRHRRQLGLILALVAASGVCTSLVAVRVVLTGHLGYAFLVKNLVLAWMPLVFAVTALALGSRTDRPNFVLAWMASLAWLLFFPNAPYLMTDLMHLRRHGNPLFWFDMVTLPSFAWTGLILGFASLLCMQALAARRFGKLASWFAAALALGLGAFGISLGRFHRWNSWDVVTQPAELFADILSVFSHPFDNVRTLAFSALFTLFLTSTYLVVYALTHVGPEPDPAP